MSNKLYFLISFVLVLSLAGNVLAYDIMMWDNDEGNGDRLWDTATNWISPGKIPKYPAYNDWAALDEYLGDPNNGPIINADMNAVAMWIDIGYYTSDAEVILTMEGGSLKVGLWLSMNYYQGGYYRLDITGGTIDVNYVYAGLVADTGSATINMSGGAFNTPGYQRLATDFGYLAIGTGVLCPQADMNMTGGYADVGWLQIGSFDTRTGKGHVDLHGGTLEADILGMGGGGEGTMDFAYDGTLIIDGDYRVPNGWLFDPCDPCSNTPLLGPVAFPVDFPVSIVPVDWDGYTGTIGILVKRGLITAYGTKVGEIITDDINHPNEVGLRAVVNLDYDVTNPGQTTITGGAVDPNLAWDPDPLFGGGLLATDDLLSWAAGDNAASHEVYLGTSFDDVNDANTASDPNIYRGSQELADVNYPVSTVWGTTYYWRIDEVNDPNTWKGTVWNFPIIPASVTNPRPTGTGVNPLLPVLKWGPGPIVADVNGHYVYFSSDFNDVNDRDPDPNVRTVVSDPCFPLGLLELYTQYYWAVDEFNDSEDPKFWPSPVLNFTTTDHIPVDDMDSYVDSEALKDTWHDWFTAVAGTAQDNSEVLRETTIVHGADSSSSMEYRYNNWVGGGGAKVRWSESWAYASDLGAGADWSLGGSSKSLVLYFYGDLYNFENSVPAGHGADPVYDRMWVGLEDGSGAFAMVHCDDMNEIDEPWWHEWNIRLQDFNDGGVDLTDVNNMYIGFGVRASQTVNGTEGKVYFDDIRTYPPRCVSSLIVADITGDCKTNYADVDIMARDWLMYDYNIPAVAISGAPVGWWQFDEGKFATTADISGYGNHGTIFNERWVDGYPNDPNDSALHFDGDRVAFYDRVECAVRINEGNQVGDYPAELMPATFTVAFWAKIDSFDYFEGLVGAGTDWGQDECGFYFYSSGHSGNETLGLMISTEDSLNFVETQNIYKIDTWYHLAATYNDANMVSIYVDGQQVPCGLARGGNPATFGGPIKPADVGGPIKWMSNNGKYPPYFAIGAFPSGDGFNRATWYYGDATIDDVRVYGYAMPPGEIVTLAEQGPTLYFELASPANIYDLEAKTFKKVNFRDYVILADHWLGDPALWPLQ